MNWQDRLNWWGLALNFVGAVIIAVAIGKPKNGIHLNDRGKITHMAAVLRPRVFRFGLGIMAIEYVLQLIASWS